MFIFLHDKFVPEEAAKISIFDRGFTYGDGLFETLRICNGKPFRWGEHWQRLARGAEFLKIKLPFSSMETFCLVEQLLEENKSAGARPQVDTILRINVSSGVGAR